MLSFFRDVFFCTLSKQLPDAKIYTRSSGSIPPHPSDNTSPLVGQTPYVGGADFMNVLELLY